MKIYFWPGGMWFIDEEEDQEVLARENERAKEDYEHSQMEARQADKEWESRQ